MAEPLVQPVKVVQPVQLQSKLKLKLEDWSSKAQLYSNQAKLTQDKLVALQTPVEPALPKPTNLFEKINQVYVTPTNWQKTIEASFDAVQKKPQVLALTTELDRSRTFQKVYGTLPAIIAGLSSEDGKTVGSRSVSLDDAMKALGSMSSLSQQEQNQVKLDVQEMVDSFSSQGMASQSEPLNLAPLQAPQPPPRMLGVQVITVQAIRASLMAPRVPNPVLDTAEYDKLLATTGEVENLGDAIDLRKQAEELAKEIQDNDAMVQAFRDNIDKLPDPTFASMVKLMISQPALAMTDAMNNYFSHTAWVGAASAWSNVIPDIDTAYYKHLAEGTTKREALSMAWQEWNPPGDKIPVIGFASNFVLKSILMEFVFDPMNLVGWGILSKATKGVKLLRWMGVLEEGYMSTMNLPIDALKYVNSHTMAQLGKEGVPIISGIAGKLSTNKKFTDFMGSDSIIPRTAGQRSASDQRLGTGVIKKGLEDDYRLTTNTLAGSYKIPMTYFANFIKKATDYAIEHPTSETSLANAGRYLLHHAPLDEDEVKMWAKALSSNIELTPDRMLMVNEVFDDYFTKRLDKDVKLFGSRLVSVFNSSMDNASDIATKLITNREKKIIGKVMAYGKMSNTSKAILAIGDDIYKTGMDTQASKTYLARMRMGKVAGLMEDGLGDGQRVWSKYIDKMVTQPVAHTSLLMAGYGIGNIPEDIIRSFLGGVAYGRYSARRMSDLTAGIITDPDMMYTSMSEQMGLVQRAVGETHGAVTWSDYLATLPLSIPTFGVSAMLEAIGVKGIKAITPKKFAEGAHGALVWAPGALGMDIKRNFTAKWYTRFLSEDGGLAAKALLDLHYEYKLSNKAINKLVNELVPDALLQGNPQMLLDLKKALTVKTIREGEVRKLLIKYPELHSEMRQRVLGWLESGELFGEIPVKGAPTPKDPVTGRFITANDSIKTKMQELLGDIEKLNLKTPDMAGVDIKKLADTLGEFGIDNKEGMAQALKLVQIASELAGSTPTQTMAAASLHTRGLPLEQRFEAIGSVLDDIAKFRASSKLEMDRISADLDAKLSKLATDGKVELSYYEAVINLKNLQVKKAMDLSDLTAEMDMWRRTLFATVKKGDLKTDKFWSEQFYPELDGWVQKINTLNDDFEDKMMAARKSVNESGGWHEPQRSAPVIVTGELTTKDIGDLLGLRGDELTSAMMDSLSFINDRGRFIRYVKRYIQKGDAGFDDDSIGKAYDQMMEGLTGGEAGWLKKQKMQLNGLSRDLHELYNSKLVGQKDVDSIGGYLDDLARKVDQTIYAEPAIQNVAEDLGFFDQVLTKNDVDNWDKTVKGVIDSGDIVISPTLSLEDFLKFKPEIGKVSPIPKDGNAFSNSLKTRLVQIGDKVGTDKANKLLELTNKLQRDFPVMDELQKLFGSIDFKVLDSTIIKRRLIDAGNQLPSDPVAIKTIQRIRAFAQEAADVDRLAGNLTEHINKWFNKYPNETLQQIGKLAESSPEYLAGIRKILKEKYTTGYIRIYRGGGKAGKEFLNREYTNVTGSQKTARYFEDNWMGTTKDPMLNNVLVKVDDVIAIGSVDETELIIPTKVLRDRIANPLRPVTMDRKLNSQFGGIGQKVYRGSNYKTKLGEGDFPGVFVSSSKDAASQYGTVSEFSLSTQKLIDIDNNQSKSLFKEFSNIYPKDVSEITSMDDLFLFPTNNWKNFLSSKGYTGTSIGQDMFIFNPGDIKSWSGSGKSYNDIRQTAYDKSMKKYYREFTDYTTGNFFDAMMKNIYPFWSISEDTEVLSRNGWRHYYDLDTNDELLSFDKDSGKTYWDKIQYINVYDYDGVALHIKDGSKDFISTPNHWWLVKRQRKDDWEFVQSEQLQHMMRLPKAAPHSFDGSGLLTPDEAALIGWVVTDGSLYKDKYATEIAQTKQPYVDEIRNLLTRLGYLGGEHTYADGCHHFRLTIKGRDFVRSKIAIYGLTYIVTHLSEESSISMWTAMYHAEGKIDGGGFVQKVGDVLIAYELLSFVCGKFVTTQYHSAPDIWTVYTHKSKYAWLRSSQLLWENYKGKMWCPRVEHRTILMRRNNKVAWTGNTYESQVWQYLPRVILQHPNVLGTVTRWNNNTDQSYYHVPGTNVETRLGAGTVFGRLTGRLMKQDFPEYYDSIPGVSGFTDWLARYGFYPGAAIGIPISLFGGDVPQVGDIIPSMPKSIFSIMTAMAPDNEAVKFITEKFFPDRFRDYMITREMIRLGGDGVTIKAKMGSKVKLSEEEQSLWDMASGNMGWYAALAAQTGLLRIRPDEMVQIKAASQQAIQDMFGLTPQQQDYYTSHGYKLEDVVGGLSKDQQTVLQTLGYYKYSGASRSLQPGAQQDIQDSITLAYNDIRKYSTSLIQEKLQADRDMLTGAISASDYLSSISTTTMRNREYWYNKAKELTPDIPKGLTPTEEREFVQLHSLLTLEGKAEHLKQFGYITPMLNPMDELLNLYFSIELKQIVDENGAKVNDWDTFFAERDAVSGAVPDQYKQEWDGVMSKNSTMLEGVHRQVNTTYFSKYNKIWDTLLAKYDPAEQRLVNEYLYLERMNMNMGRQDELRLLVDGKGRQLISGFKSDVSDAKKALRFANPQLDAWLYFWGKTNTLLTPQSEQSYNQISIQLGRKL